MHRYMCMQHVYVHATVYALGGVCLLKVMDERPVLQRFVVGHPREQKAVARLLETSQGGGNGTKALCGSNGTWLALDFARTRSFELVLFMLHVTYHITCCMLHSMLHSSSGVPGLYQ